MSLIFDTIRDCSTYDHLSSMEMQMTRIVISKQYAAFTIVPISIFDTIFRLLNLSRATLHAAVALIFLFVIFLSEKLLDEEINQRQT